MKITKAPEVKYDPQVEAIKLIANAITALDAHGGNDAFGGHVTSLTEAVMGLTKGMSRIAEAMQSLADAVSSHNPEYRRRA